MLKKDKAKWMPQTMINKRTGLFTKMALKTKKEAPDSPKVEIKAKALRPRKQCWKVSTARNKNRRSRCHPLWFRRQPKYPLKTAPRRKKLDHYAIIKFPLTTESTVKKTEDSNTLVFSVHVNANKHQTKQAVKKLYDIDMAKDNTWSDLMGRRGHRFNGLLTMMLRTLPTKLGSSKLSPADWF